MLKTIQKHNVSGLTLLELLITLAIVLILIPMGVSNYKQILAQHYLIQSTENLFHFLNLAKSQAVKDNKKIYIHFCQFGTEPIWKIAMSDLSDCQCFTKNSCLLNGREIIQDLSDGKRLFVSSNQVTFGSKQASFSPMRFATNSGSVTIVNAYNQKTKVIQSAMRARICIPDAAKYGYPKC